MPFEILLNLLWVCVGAGALSLLACSEVCKRSRNAAQPASRRFLSLVIAILFLFPYVSESDDLVTLSNLQFTLETRGELETPMSQREGGERPGSHWTGWLDDLTALPFSALCALLLMLLCVAMVVPRRTLSFERPMAAAAGRAPPRFSL